MSTSTHNQLCPSSATRDHELDVVLDAAQVEEGVDVVELVAQPPALVVHRVLHLPFEVPERVPQLVTHILPPVRRVRHIIVRPPQRIHRCNQTQNPTNSLYSLTQVNVINKKPKKLAT